MFSLESPRWASLKRGYGAASDTPALLRQLESLPSSENDAEPWFSIWSSLAHQGDVYSASFAAVPHVVDYLAKAPDRAGYSFFHFPAWVEVCRDKRNVTIPDDLSPAYWEALGELPRLVAKAATREWDEPLLSCALAAIAAAKGHPVVAEAILEMNTEVTQDFLKWYLEL